ncbi:MAG: DUF1080 domain-containing protein [Bryobacteraceae bacterium]|jgi:hypothetical protein
MLQPICSAALLAALPLAGLWAADNQLTPRETAAGWTLLFNGHDFSHWEDPARKSPAGDSFVIEDGCLRAVAHPRIVEDLFSAENYGDFELEWDWKISPAGNSGLKYRIQDRVFLTGQHAARFEDMVNQALGNRPANRPSRGQEYVVGFEYQITDDIRNGDAVHGGPRHQTAALYDILPPLTDRTRPVGEFNHSRLVVRGKHIEHWLNGEKVLEGDLDAAEVATSMTKRWGEGSRVWELLVKQPRARCPISLQNHGDEAWFKNIRIRPLN